MCIRVRACVRSYVRTRELARVCVCACVRAHKIFKVTTVNQLDNNLSTFHVTKQQILEETIHLLSFATYGIFHTAWTTIFACLFVAAVKCLPNRCLGFVVTSGFTIPVHRF
jgi:hypothetical protein